MAPARSDRAEGERPLPDRRSVLGARIIVLLFRVLEQAAKQTELTIPQFRFMLTLRRGPRRVSDLASLSGIGRPTASALVSDMERKGLIYRTPDGVDGRAVELRLTDEGLRRYAALDERLAETFDALLPDDLRDPVLDSLAALAEELDRRRQDGHDRLT